jgi:putative aminopeptidase FrvX
MANIHTRKAEETPKINLFIDIGCETKEEVDKCSCRMRHHPDEFYDSNDNKFVCRAIDNRMGVL